MNLYLVTSELLSEMVWEDWFARAGHEELYQIAELVIANSPSQARWLAWKQDNNTFTGDPREMPKMSCTIRAASIFDNGIPEVVTNEPLYQFGWDNS